MDKAIVVVTGASTGLGRAICVEAATRGAAAVVVNYVSSRDEAAETARQVEALGAEVRVVQGDVSIAADCEAIVEKAERFGRIDALFNNAGITTFTENHGDLDAVSMEDFMNIYRVNVGGAFQMVRAARPLLEAAEEPSAIVNTASFAGVTGTGSSLPYACSKGAMVTMTLSLARALAPKIRVNAVCPGFIDTPWYSKGMTEEEIDKRRQQIADRAPLKVASSAEDVAAATVFLASTAARRITGETLLVDAGMHLNFAPLAMR
jgi:NAD(P)-dependent dehydrogenase (short-subunit alcohol dehydrogenase family)